MGKSRQDVTSKTQTRNYPQPGRGPPAREDDDRGYHLQTLFMGDPMAACSRRVTDRRPGASTRGAKTAKTYGKVSWFAPVQKIYSVLVPRVAVGMIVASESWTQL